MTEYLMSHREYESALKEVLEEVAYALDWHEPELLKKLYLPQNVKGSKKITLDQWLDAREEKRQRVEGVGFQDLGVGQYRVLGIRVDPRTGRYITKTNETKS